MAYFIDQVFISIKEMCSCMGQVMGLACELFSFRSRFAFCLISAVHGYWVAPILFVSDYDSDEAPGIVHPCSWMIGTSILKPSILIGLTS